MPEPNSKAGVINTPSMDWEDYVLFDLLLMTPILSFPPPRGKGIKKLSFDRRWANGIASF